MTIELGERLAKLRKKAGLSQEQLAEELGVSRQAVSRWETGEAAPDTENLIALADIFNVSIDELIREQKKGQPKGEPEEVEVVDGIVVDKPKHEDHRPSAGEGFAWSLFSIACLAGYLTAGFCWRSPDGGYVGWASMWVLLLLTPVVGSVFHAIRSHRITKFNLFLLVVIVYVGMGIIGNFYGQNFWHPYWAEFFLVPLFYSIGSFIDGRVDKED